MNRLFYILWRIANDIGSLASRALNALVLRGSTAQTTSSRAHLDPKLRGLRRIINAIFFWQEDHCASAWAADVERARWTLKVNEASQGEER